MYVSEQQQKIIIVVDCVKLIIRRASSMYKGVRISFHTHTRKIFRERERERERETSAPQIV